MIDSKYLEEEQVRLFKYFYNAKKIERIPNAVLLHGATSTPLTEMAKYIAKSINCHEDIFACNKCSSCIKFENNNLPDVIFIDGSKTIKKENIELIQNKFAYAATESNNYQIYIISNIENITVEAANSLLKFLEEPKTKVVAIFTSNNILKVLNTIRSRCLILELNQSNILFSQYLDITKDELSSYLYANLNLPLSIEENIKDKELKDILVESIRIYDSLKRDLKEASFLITNSFNNFQSNSSNNNLFLKSLKLLVAKLINELIKEQESSDHILKLINVDSYINEVISKSLANLNIKGILGRIAYLIYI